MSKKSRSTAGNGSTQTVAQTIPAGNGNTTSITIQGLTFHVPAPYSEGHVLTAIEATALNQTLSENLRNNFAKAVKNTIEAARAVGEEPNKESLDAKLAAYAADYSFSGRRPRATADPIFKEATKIARSKVMEALHSKGIDPKTVSDDNFQKLITTVMEKYPEQTLEEARRRIESARAIALDTLDLVGVAE